MKFMSLIMFMVLLHAPATGYSEPCPLDKGPPTVQVDFVLPGLTLLLPEAWRISKEQHSRGAIVADTNTGCRVEVARMPGARVDQVVMLHERLYWGQNVLSQECRAAVAAELPSGRSVHVGRYEPRTFGYYWLVTAVETECGCVEMVTYKCPTGRSRYLTLDVLSVIASSTKWN